MQIIEGNLVAKNAHIAIVVSRFNKDRVRWTITILLL